MNAAHDTTAPALGQFQINPSPSPTGPAERAQILSNPGFGSYFTDHMARVTWHRGGGWGNPRVEPYGPIAMDPSTAVLHYSQTIFEGLKAYRHADGSIWTFRPEANAARMRASASRMSLPELPDQVFIDSLHALVHQDHEWVPTGGETSLYLRPFMIATEVFLGVRPAATVEYVVIASPAGNYFPRGPQPLNIWISRDYIRAAPGGTGAAKTGGNYAAGLVAQQEAVDNGCDQVCFVDATERRYVEELNGMNLFFVYDDGSLVTPALGTILPGITRASLIELARERGHQVVERPYSVQEWCEDAESGRLREVFACGTAAVITPVGAVVDQGKRYQVADGGTGVVTASLRQHLVDLQYGRVEDTHGWLHPLVTA